MYSLGGLDTFYYQQHPNGFIPREITPSGDEFSFFEGQSNLLLLTSPRITDADAPEKLSTDLHLEKDDPLFLHRPDWWKTYQAYRDPLRQQQENIRQAYRTINNTNPPLAAHAEWQHYLMTRNIDRLERVIPVLEKHTEWLENNRQLKGAKYPDLQGLFWQGSMGSGMDNLPSTIIVSNKHHPALYRLGFYTEINAVR